MTHMPLEREGKQWLNATESSEELGVSFVTFQTIRDTYNLHKKGFPGQGRQVFYLAKHIDLIKNSSSDEETVKRVREQISQEQTW